MHSLPSFLSLCLLQHTAHSLRSSSVSDLQGWEEPVKMHQLVLVNALPSLQERAGDEFNISSILSPVAA